MTILKISEFKAFVERTIPSVFDDSLTYYEQLGKVIAFLTEIATQTNATIDFVESSIGQQDIDLALVQANFTTLSDELNSLYTQFTNDITGTVLVSNLETILDQMVIDGDFDSVINVAIGSRFDDVDAELALKETIINSDAKLALKADQTAVDDALALKADQTAVNDALALKADQTAVDDALALKADQTAVDEVDNAIGNLTLLTTVEKTNIVSALNELNGAGLAKHGVSGSNQNTTGGIVTGTNALTLSNSIDFKNGQGIAVMHAGSPCVLSAPINIGVVGTGAVGAETYEYKVIALDDNYGTSPASLVGTVATRPETLNATDYNTVSWNTVVDAVAYAVYGRKQGEATWRFVAWRIGNSVTSIRDYGNAQTTSRPVWCPADVPPATALSQALLTKIVSGAGTTNLVLADNAITTAISQPIYHDDYPGILSACDDAINNGSKVVKFPVATYWCWSGFSFNFTYRGLSWFGESPGPFDPWGGSTPGEISGATFYVVNPVDNFLYINQAINLSIENVMIMYPFQSHKDCYQPVAYPPTIQGGNIADFKIKNSSLFNPYDGIFMDSNLLTGRCHLENLNIGSYHTGIQIDYSVDVTYINNIFVQNYWQLSTCNLAKWVEANGYGMVVYRADALDVKSFSVYKRFMGIRLNASPDAGQSPRASYGMGTNWMFDQCMYPLRVEDTNYPGWVINGMEVASSNGGVGVWLNDTPGYAEAYPIVDIIGLKCWNGSGTAKYVYQMLGELTLISPRFQNASTAEVVFIAQSATRTTRFNMAYARFGFSSGVNAMVLGSTLGTGSRVILNCNDFNGLAISKASGVTPAYFRALGNIGYADATNG